MTDLLDRRQRLAAAILLSAIDLPAPLPAYAQHALEAAKVCPGLNVAEAAFGAGRVAGLLKARDLVDELLAEAGVARPGPGDGPQTFHPEEIPTP